MELTKKRPSDWKTRKNRSLYDYTPENPPKMYTQLVRDIALLTGYSKPEVMLVFDAICAVIHNELVNVRPVRLPGVGTIVPYTVYNIVQDCVVSDGAHQPGVKFVSPTFIRTKFKGDKELRVAFRKDHPYYVMDENGDPIEDVTP